MERVYRGYPQALRMMEAGTTRPQSGMAQAGTTRPQSGMAQAGIMHPQAGMTQEGTARMMQAGTCRIPARLSNVPDMPYSQESQAIQPPAVRGQYFAEQEAEYFKGLYPQPVRGDQRLVEEVLSRMDYAGSPVYDQYPDREFIYRLRDMIARRSVELGFQTSRELIQVLLVSEINRRRMMRFGAGLLA